jgi:hypothetical protein
LQLQPQLLLLSVSLSGIFFRVTVNKSGVLTAGIKMLTPLEMYEGDEHGL